MTHHRPWPLPERRWLWRQSWCDLLFAHWPVPVTLLRPLIPDGLEIQEKRGSGWVGVVPFRMSGVMRRPLPDLPGFSAFPEWNLRTYVTRDGRDGVWFFSLDATKTLAVWGGRFGFYLPYHRARIRVSHQRGNHLHRARRLSGKRPEFAASYRPNSAVFEAEAGGFEHWLTERYCLYAQKPDGSLFRTEVHHRPWPLQRVEAEIDAQALAACSGIVLNGPPAHCLFSERVDVVAWNPVRLTGPTRKS